MTPRDLINEIAGSIMILGIFFIVLPSLLIFAIFQHIYYYIITGSKMTRREVISWSAKLVRDTSLYHGTNNFVHFAAFPYKERSNHEM